MRDNVVVTTARSVNIPPSEANTLFSTSFNTAYWIIIHPMLATRTAVPTISGWYVNRG